MNFWFTSDYHFGHENIIKYCGRPFTSLHHMNATLIKNHNDRVEADDTVFFLGDFCFKNSAGGKAGEGALHKAEHYINQLNGNFVFIKGNHDNNNSLKAIIESATIFYGGKQIRLIHNPKDYKPGMLNFAGHVHEKWKFQIAKDKYKTLIVNVGCDVWDFRPVSFNEIMKEYRRWIKNDDSK